MKTYIEIKTKLIERVCIATKHKFGFMFCQMCREKYIKKCNAELREAMKEHFLFLPR